MTIAVSEREELRQLRKEVGEFRREHEILRKAAAYGPGDGPVCRFRFVHEYRGAYDVKRVCAEHD